MIVGCNNCKTKFNVRDSDIPINGRIVQCSNCSTRWLQKPISSSVTNVKPELDENLSTRNELEASDGKRYIFLGNQWAEVLPSGKTGRLAKKKIGTELDIRTGKKKRERNVKKIKAKINSEQKYAYREKEKKGLNLFVFLIVLIAAVAAIILLLDTFKNQLTPFFPKLDNYLVYIFETLNNIYFIIKDLLNNYK